MTHQQERDEHIHLQRKVYEDGITLLSQLQASSLARGARTTLTHPCRRFSSWPCMTPRCCSWILSAWKDHQERLNDRMSLPSVHEPHVKKTGLPDLAAISGLAEQEAQRRLKQEGTNELPLSHKRSLLIIALDVVREPMFLLLLAGSVVYLALGDVREALALLVVIRRISRPHDAVLGSVEGIDGYQDIEGYANSETVPGLIAYRFDAPLFFANAGYFLSQVRELIASAESPVLWLLITENVTLPCEHQPFLYSACDVNAVCSVRRYVSLADK